jgi:hypothetical protein
MTPAPNRGAVAVILCCAASVQKSWLFQRLDTDGAKALRLGQNAVERVTRIELA